MNKTKIEWCDYTWNPITGCKRGCEYCYARRIHERFYKSPFSEIVFHPERLNDPAKIKKPSTIFVGSMSDIQYWGVSDFDKILTVCRDNPQHTFMFLSKNEGSYCSPYTNWPFNTMQGLTITSTENKFHEESILQFLRNTTRPFLSIEPLLGEVLRCYGLSKMEKIIVGAMTGPSAKPPEKEWIESVLTNVPKEKLFIKENVKKYIGKQ